MKPQHSFVAEYHTGLHTIAHYAMTGAELLPDDTIAILDIIQQAPDEDPVPLEVMDFAMVVLLGTKDEYTQKVDELSEMFGLSVEARVVVASPEADHYAIFEREFGQS